MSSSSKFIIFYKYKLHTNDPGRKWHGSINWVPLYYIYGQCNFKSPFHSLIQLLGFSNKTLPVIGLSMDSNYVCTLSNTCANQFEMFLKLTTDEQHFISAKNEKRHWKYSAGQVDINGKRNGVNVSRQRFFNKTDLIFILSFGSIYKGYYVLL